MQDLTLTNKKPDKRGIHDKLKQLFYYSFVPRQIYKLLTAIRNSSYKLLSDDLQCKLIFYKKNRRKLDIKNPTTFNEKLAWLKINYRNPLMTRCSDKYLVREYIKECGYESILTPLQGVYASPHDINFRELQGKYFIKTTHGSGGNLAYDSDKAHTFDFDAFYSRFSYALKQNHFWGNREWNYKNIKPRILVEHLLETNGEFFEYRFFCFHGKVKIICIDKDATQADGQHNTNLKRNLYTPEFEFMPIRYLRDNYDISENEKPENLQEMIACAETLASPFIFCRVDLYNLNGKIGFGEMTFYPCAGVGGMEPISAETEIGNWITLPK